MQPFTWEGCVVKIADKIAFYGRDLEDAIMLRLITAISFGRGIYRVLPKYDGEHRIRNKLHSESKQINNTTLIHSFILDLLECSSPEKGLQFSPWYRDFLKALRKVSEDLIYNHPRLKYSKRRAKLIIESIFEELTDIEVSSLTVEKIEAKLKNYPSLEEVFSEWMIKYSNLDEDSKKSLGFYNKTIYDIQNKNQYIKAVIDFIAGMTDNFAIKVFEELTRFS